MAGGSTAAGHCSFHDLAARAHSILCAALLLSATIVCQAQIPFTPAVSTTSRASISPQRYGSVVPEELSPVFKEGRTVDWFEHRRIRSYGWLDGGYTYSSSGDYLLNVAPESNRYGNRFLLNGAWLILERPVASEGWSWGFRSDFYAGADAALLRPMNSFGPQGKRFGTDFRQLNATVHIPVLSPRGVDLLLGRTNVPLGFETLMAPYRPMYSQTYFWIYFQVAATGAFATWHATPSLDLEGGSMWGYNTIFTTRGRAPDYTARAVYRPGNSGKTVLIGTVLTGPRPAPWAAGHSGSWQTVAELQARHLWNPRFTEMFQVNSSWNTKDPKIGGLDAATHGAFSIATFHLDKALDLNAREEWFSDPRGVRTGSPGHFEESSLGFNVMPLARINFRPEVRYDMASQPSFGPVTEAAAQRARDQLTVGIDMILKFSAVR